MTAQEGFVIQLFGGYDQNNAKSFIDNEHKKLINARLYMYETTYNKKPWFVVVAGIYPSRNNAEQAVKSMPKELQKLSPWVRDIKTVRSEEHTSELQSRPHLVCRLLLEKKKKKKKKKKK